MDPAKAQLLERVGIGARPRGLRLSRDKRRLFVAIGGGPSAGLAIFDVQTLKVTGHTPTAPAPFGVDLSPDERTAYLSNAETSEVLILDVVSGAIKHKTAVGTEPQGVAVRPDGKVVYVATRGSNEVSAIDAKTMTLLGRMDAGLKPQTVLFPPKGEIAFVTAEELPTIAILDTRQNASKEQFLLEGLAKRTPTPTLQSAVFSPDGKSLYVTTGPGRSVLIIDPVKKAMVGAIDGVGAFPRGIAISRDGKKLYTANGPSNDVAIIDVASRKVEARVSVPGAPWGVVLLP